MAFKQNYCQVCWSKNVLNLSKMLYCENCDIYYSLEKNNQYVTSLPVTEIDAPKIKLCHKCKKIEKSSRKIKCQTFRGFLSKLNLCKNCKESNHDNIKNLYYRNFIMHKKVERIYSRIYILIFAVLSFFTLFDGKKWKEINELIIKNSEKLISRFKCNSVIFNLCESLKNLFKWGNQFNEEMNSKFISFIYTSNYSKRIVEAFKEVGNQIVNLNATKFVVNGCKHTINTIITNEHTLNALFFKYLQNVTARHILYLWYICMKYWLHSKFVILLLTAFSFYKVVFVDVLICLFGLYYMWTVTKTFYHIPESLNKEAGIQSFLKQLNLKKSQNNCLHMNSVPSFIENCPPINK
ncbi:hypothetical protein NUSPORA_02217 [Nucleospora cyclopteri]